MKNKKYPDINCEWCGKITTNKKGNRIFCCSKCQQKYWKWMIQHRRIIADGYSECPICGVGIFQSKKLSHYNWYLGCSSGHTQRAIRKGLVAKVWHEKPISSSDYKGRQFDGSNSSRDFRQIQYVQCNKKGKCQCAYYAYCLDKEIKKKGSGFKKGCQRYQERGESTNTTKAVFGEARIYLGGAYG